MLLLSEPLKGTPHIWDTRTERVGFFVCLFQSSYLTFFCVLFTVNKFVSMLGGDCNFEAADNYSENADPHLRLV